MFLIEVKTTKTQTKQKPLYSIDFALFTNVFINAMNDVFKTLYQNVSASYAVPEEYKRKTINRLLYASVLFSRYSQRRLFVDIKRRE